MKGTIIFEHDKVNDIFFAKPLWNIETKQDCEIWYQQWSDYLTPFEKKIDIVINLNEFKVASQIAEVWGEYRAKLTNSFFRFSYRVNPELITGIFIKTSGIRYHAGTKEAISIDSAIVAIKEERKKEGVFGAKV
jgi:hypothetical protein